MEKWKITLSVAVGSIFMIIPLYQVIMFGLLLTEKINYTFISFCFGISLVAFWGRLKVLAKNIQSKWGSKEEEVIETDVMSRHSKKKKDGDGATTPSKGF